VLSLGILSPAPFAHAAARRGKGWTWPVVYAAVVVALVFLAQRDDPGNTAGAGLIGVIVVAICHLVYLRRQAWRAEPAQDPAVAAALAARARREEARRIVARDRGLARELRIGRPDLTPEFDDGGLVDLATAPAAVIAQVCGIEHDFAERIVAARPLTTVDDAFTLSDIPFPLCDRIRERAVVVD
jgi:hypothetical protein